MCISDGSRPQNIPKIIIHHNFLVVNEKGYGKNASEEFINNRYAGYVVKGTLCDEQIRAAGGEELIVVHKKNQYDDTLICYTPIKRYRSTQKKELVDEIKSLACAEVSVTSVMESFNKHYLRFVIHRYLQGYRR